MDLVAIANACAVECVRQQVGIRELGFLLEAYQWISEKVGDWTSVFPDKDMPLRLSDFEILGSFVEPGKNRNGFRRQPVTFANGGSSANASEIPRLMEQLVEAIAAHALIDDGEGRESYTRMITKEFLWIHPFADGNGRVGFLLYNYLMGTLDAPLALPDFGW